jgi:chemotaxis protein MotA
MKLKKPLLNGQAMVYRNLLGFSICVLVFCSGFLLHGNTALFFNFSGMAIVVGGTLGAALVSFRMERLINVYKVLSGSYKRPLKKESEIIEVLVDLSVKRRLKGLLSLAEICPSFGVVGSVVGLIAMLGGVDDTSVILKTIPIALTSTLYGVIFANFFFLPFAANVRERTNHELLLGKIIMEGVVAIGSELHPRTLEYKLKAFLTPSSRQGRLVSLKRIQKKFRLENEKNIKKLQNYGNLRKHNF